MPITFTQVRKIQIRKYLIYILVILALFSAIYYLRNFLPKEAAVEKPEIVIKRVEIDFNLLEGPKDFFEKLLPFAEIIPTKEKGRENPFIPY